MSYLRKYKPGSVVILRLAFPDHWTHYFNVRQLFWVLEIVSKTEGMIFGDMYGMGCRNAGLWNIIWCQCLILSSMINQEPWVLEWFSLKGITSPFPHSVSSPWIIPETSSSDHIRLTCRCLTEALGVQQCWLCACPWWWRWSLQWCPPEPQSGPVHTLHSLWSLGGGLELHTLGKNKSEYIRNACGREQHLAQNIWYLVKRIYIFFHQLNERKTGWCQGITDEKRGKQSSGRRPETRTGAVVKRILGVPKDQTRASQEVQWSKGDWRTVLTPVLEKRVIQAPVFHLAVIDILSCGQEGEIVELAEKVVIPGQEDGLWHSVSDRSAISKPRDTDHRWGELVNEADECVGLSQFHRLVWEQSHFWRNWETSDRN